MESLGSEVLKQITEFLHETVQCPTCLESLRPPVTLCSNGHGLCPDCKPHIEVCPTCREGFVNTKPIILHQLLDALPRDCQFKSLGCTDVYIPSGSHEQLCSYRTVDCKLIECEWSGQARRLKDHLTSTHADLVVVLEGDTKIDITWANFNCTEDSFKYIPVINDGQVFWSYIHMNTEVNKLCISFTHPANGSSGFQYFVVISFKNGDIEFTHTIKIPLDGNHVFIDFFEEHCMTIPKNMVPRFVNRDLSSLNYTIRIIKEEE